MAPGRRRTADTPAESTRSNLPVPQAPPIATRPPPRARNAANQHAARGATGATAPSSGDEFNLDAIGPDSSDEENVRVPVLAAEPAAGSLRPSPAQSVGSAQPSLSKISSTADDVWYFFDKGSSKDNRPHVCKKCPNGKTYAPGNSSSSLRKHLDSEHRDEYIKICTAKGWEIKIESARKNLPGSTTASSLDSNRVPFSMAAFIQHLVKFVVANDQSINVVECDHFRALLLLLRESLRNSDIPHRTMMREAILEEFHHYIPELKKRLHDATGKVSFTMDIWSSQLRRSFLAITAHWISRDENAQCLEYESSLIAFHNLHGSHSGERIARAILPLLDRVGVTLKTGHWTMDNAKNNDTFIASLANLLVSERDMVYDSSQHRIMCFPHIVHICVTHVLKRYRSSREEPADDEMDEHEDLGAAILAAESMEDDFDALDGSDDEELANIPEGPPSDEFEQSYDEALRRKPLELVRAIVRAIRSSSQCWEFLQQVISDGNKSGRFKDATGETTKIPLLHLLLDVKTRWDSTYLMIERFLTARSAIDIFLSSPENKTLSKLRLTQQEWAVIEDLKKILEVPHEVQMIMAGEKLPSLCGMIPAIEMFMSGWEELSQDQPRLERFIQPGLKFAVKYYRAIDKTSSYAISMFLNPCIRLSWFDQHWDKNYVRDTKKQIIDVMHQYCARRLGASPGASVGSEPSGSESLQNKQTSMGSGQRSDPHGHQIRAWERLAYKFSNNGREADSGTTTVEDEFRQYSASMIPRLGSMDCLKFWQTNESVYPTLFMMAMDYLPIQSSSVPCERAFSSSAETDTKRRNRIHPALMEALQLLKYTYKMKGSLDFTQGLMTTEADLALLAGSRDLLADLAAERNSEALDSVLSAVGLYESDR